MIPDGYELVQTDLRVGGVRPALRTRFIGRARRRCARMNAGRLAPSYRYEVVIDNRGRHEVVAFQNVLREVGS